MIVGLERAASGRICSTAWTSRVPMYRRARMGLGYLAQEPSVFRKLTVEENILAILETGASGASAEKRAQELLDEFDIVHVRIKRGTPFPAESGGGPRSPGRWPPTRRTSSWTSPLPESTPSPWPRSSDHRAPQEARDSAS